MEARKDLFDSPDRTMMLETIARAELELMEKGAVHQDPVSTDVTECFYHLMKSIERP